MDKKTDCKCRENTSVRDMRGVLFNFRNSPGDIQFINRSHSVLNFSDISCGTATANLSNGGGQLDFALCFIFSYRPLIVSPSTCIPLKCVLPKCNNCCCIADSCQIAMRKRLKLHMENNQLLNVYSVGLQSLTRVQVIEVCDGIAVFKELGAEDMIFVSILLIESLEPIV